VSVNVSEYSPLDQQFRSMFVSLLALRTARYDHNIQLYQYWRMVLMLVSVLMYGFKCWWCKRRQTTNLLILTEMRWFTSDERDTLRNEVMGEKL